MKYKNLVLSGGGVRGVYYLSLLKYFEESQVDIREFKNFAGSSVGSFFVTAIALEYTSLELKDIALCILDYSKLKSMNIIDFFDNLGLDKGDKLEYYIKKMIRKKTGVSSITFKELYKKYNKNLIIPTVCLSNRELIYFSKDNYPNMKIWKAIRMSLGVPFLFKPFIYKNNYYVDGGLKDNFPIELFNTIDTLGIDITIKKKELNTNFNLEKLVMSLVDIVTKNKYVIGYQDVIQISSSYDSKNELLSFQPDIDEITIKQSLEYAYLTIEQYFKNRKNDIYTYCNSIVLETLTF